MVFQFLEIVSLDKHLSHLSYKSRAEMAIAIFTTTSPEVAEPYLRRLSFTAVSSSITFLAMSQKLSNFVFFRC